ncbi:MAG TPA: hypothetical protein VG778_01520 [Blastocatellia bacterium]|nr:hypothetical protein [Blastocatellia bacterium]
MNEQSSKKFIAGVLLTLLSLGSLAWISTRTTDSASAAAPVARTATSPVANGTQPPYATPVAETTAATTQFDEGYRAGYQDAQADLAASTQQASYTTRAAPARTRVVRVASRAPARKKGHSTRNMILRIAAPAAIGAGVGALVGGKKGAGVGALLGGGGGAVYHLSRKDR